MKQNKTPLSLSQSSAWIYLGDNDIVHILSPTDKHTFPLNFPTLFPLLVPTQRRFGHNTHQYLFMWTRRVLIESTLPVYFLVLLQVILESSPRSLAFGAIRLSRHIYPPQEEVSPYSSISEITLATKCNSGSEKFCSLTSSIPVSHIPGEYFTVGQSTQPLSHQYLIVKYLQFYRRKQFW